MYQNLTFFVDLLKVGSLKLEFTLVTVEKTFSETSKGRPAAQSYSNFSLFYCWFVCLRGNYLSD